ncbi:MAG: LacI family DNA-binding transcriptional regulator [Pseudomonadota bacterium]
MTTIIDVAKKAGVSIKTVSRVMNNQANVRDETRRRVREAMDLLDYSPNEAAQRMRSGKSSAIAMMYADPSGGYQSRFNHAMMQACSDAGRYLAVGLFEEEKGHWKEQLERFLDRTKVERLVLLPPMCDSSILQDCLKQLGVRFVLVSPSRPAPSAPAVTMDDKSAAREMTQHLINLGHRRIAHITGRSDHIATLLRRQGYEEAINTFSASAKITPIVIDGQFDFRVALANVEKLLARKNRPTAIFAASDDMAAAAYMAAGKLGLNIPTDISIVGFDDVPIAQTIWPSLTTVAQPFEAMARECVRLLCGHADFSSNDNLTEFIIVPHTVVVRESCAKIRP